MVEYKHKLTEVVGCIDTSDVVAGLLDGAAEQHAEDHAEDLPERKGGREGRKREM